MTNDLDNGYGEIDMEYHPDQDVYAFDERQTFDRMAEEQQARQGTPVNKVIIALLAFLVLAIVIAGWALWTILQNPTMW